MANIRSTKREDKEATFFSQVGHFKMKRILAREALCSWPWVLSK